MAVNACIKGARGTSARGRFVQQGYGTGIGLGSSRLRHPDQLLRHTGENQPQAAQILGITRNSLHHKLRALGITIARAVCAADDQADP